jgi:Helix-turn-helix domain
MNATSTMVAEMNLKPLGKKVLNYMRTRGAISPLVAFSTYGTMRLAAQIHDLREAGFDIVTTIKEDEEGDTYASYRLVEPLKRAA